MSLHVTVTTAVALSAAQRKAVTEVAQKKSAQKDIELIEVVDPQVVGGIKLTLGSQQYDATVHGALEATRSQA